MFFRILKNDLKRKKVMNVTLLLFIILATIFVSSGLNNVITVFNGIDYYFDKAGIGNYYLITLGDDSKDSIENFLSKEKAVDEYKVEPIVFLAKDDVFVNEKKSKSQNDLIFQSLKESKITFFDSDNKRINHVKPGHAYVGGDFMVENHLKPGDKILIKKGTTRLELILDGKTKDALLGSDFFGNCRFLLNSSDSNRLIKEKTIAGKRQGKIAYIVTNNLRRMESSIGNLQSVSFSASRATMRLVYIVDMVFAFIVLILSVCLILVAFAVLRFSINFTIMEEFREIGVMKAIGIGNFKIRYLYIIKYLILALSGTFLGFFLSFPFGNILLKSVIESMVLDNNLGVIPNLLGAKLVILLIALFSYHSTAKIKKLRPLDAIRSGQKGERYKPKTVYSLEKSLTRPSFFMALNDVLSYPRRYLSIVLSFFLCTLFVLILVNTTETINSDRLIDTLGSRADLYITDDNQVNKDMLQKDMGQLKENLRTKKDEIKALGIPSMLSTEVVYKYKITFHGEKYFLNAIQGVNTKAVNYHYSKGSAPQNSNEIAITPIISEMTGAKIGDTLIIDYGGKKEKLLVTAYYQTMNQVGQLIMLHEDAPTSMSYATNVLQYRVTFIDHPSKKLIEKRKEKLKKHFHNNDIMNAKEYCIDSFAVGDAIRELQYLLLTIVLVIVSLVTLITEFVFIGNEKCQIAVLKAIGFQNKVIIKWQVYRFVIVGLISVLLASMLSIPVTKICISPLFGMMGANEISFNIVFWKIFLLYPSIILVITVLIASLSALYVRTFKCSDTSNIE